MKPEIIQRSVQTDRNGRGSLWLCLFLADIRNLLEIPDTEVDMRLARAMGWQELKGLPELWTSPKGSKFDRSLPPAYCSESSPRSLLGEVEELIGKDDGDMNYVSAIREILQVKSQMIAWWELTTASSAVRARAALWVLEARA